MASARSISVVAAALLVLCQAGCFTERPRQASLFASRPPFEGPTGNDVVQIDMAFLEKPPQDHYLNHEMWAEVDEQTIEPEQKAVLHDNGFRVGQVGGYLPPGELKDLLTSPRSCIDPRRVCVHARQPTPVLLGPVWSHLQLQVVRKGSEAAVDLDNAQCLLEVVPVLADDGRTTLRFTPHVKHGQAILGFAPLRDPSGALRWERQEQQPEEVYSWLSWDVTVAPNEFVVVGTHLERLTTLGQRCFLPGEDGPRVQRLLILRTRRALQRDAVAQDRPHRVLELAEQAQAMTARGSRE